MYSPMEISLSVVEVVAVRWEWSRAAVVLVEEELWERLRCVCVCVCVCAEEMRDIRSIREEGQTGITFMLNWK